MRSLDKYSHQILQFPKIAPKIRFSVWKHSSGTNLENVIIKEQTVVNVSCEVCLISTILQPSIFCRCIYAVDFTLFKWLSRS